MQTVELENGAGPGAQNFTGALAEILVGQSSGPGDGPRPKIPWEACHPVWQTGAIGLAAGAGTLLNSNLYGPEQPYWWDIKALSVWGFTAGLITVNVNNAGGEQIAQIAGSATVTGAQFTWSKQIMLGPQDSLVFTASGVTGNVNVIVRATEIETAWLAEYLM